MDVLGLISFQSAEMVAFVNFVQVYSVFVGENFLISSPSLSWKSYHTCIFVRICVPCTSNSKLLVIGTMLIQSKECVVKTKHMYY